MHVPTLIFRKLTWLLVKVVSWHSDASGAVELCPGVSSVTAKSVEVCSALRRRPWGQRLTLGLPAAAGRNAGTEADSALVLVCIEDFV